MHDLGLLSMLVEASTALETLGSQQFVVSAGLCADESNHRIAPISSDGQPFAFSGQSLASGSLHIGCYAPDTMERPVAMDLKSSSMDFYNPVILFLECAELKMKVS